MGSSVKCKNNHHLSIGGSLNFRVTLPENDGGESIQKYERINGLGIVVNSAYTPSATFLTAANEAREMLYLITRPF